MEFRELLNFGTHLNSIHDLIGTDALRLACIDAVCRSEERRKQFPEAVAALKMEDTLFGRVLYHNPTPLNSSMHASDHRFMANPSKCIRHHLLNP